MKDKKSNTTNFLMLKEYLRKFNAKNLPKKIDEVELLIDDMILDIKDSGEIVTDRIVNTISDKFDIDNSNLDKFLKAYGDWLLDNSMNENVDDIIFEVTKAKAPTLTGKAEKARKGKAEVMSLVNKSEKVVSAKNKLFKAIEIEARRIAKEKGLNPSLINLDKVTIRR